MQECDRHTAAVGFEPADEVHGEHHNHQLVLYGISILFMLGAFIEHYLEVTKLPLPYTMTLLVFGCLVGTWLLLDPRFTLQPGMMAGEEEWDGRLLRCNVTKYIANDLFAEGSHFGNAVRNLAEVMRSVS